MVQDINAPGGNLMLRFCKEGFPPLRASDSAKMYLKNSECSSCVGSRCKRIASDTVQRGWIHPHIDINDSG